MRSCRAFAVIFFLLLINAATGNAQAWVNFRDSARIAGAQRNQAAAVHYLSLATTSLPADSAHSITRLQLLTEAGKLSNSLGHYAEALRIFTEARDVAAILYNTQDEHYAHILFNVGLCFYYLHQFDKAIASYQQAQSIWKKTTGTQVAAYAAVCNALGVLYNNAGEYRKSEAAHREALNIREKLFTRENGDYAQSCNNLAACYMALGDYEKAEPLALEAKELRGSLPGIPKRTYAISCVNLGNIYRELGKYKQAEELYIEAKDAREKELTKKHPDYVASANILAGLYYFMGEFEKADTLYREAKTIVEELSGAASFQYGESSDNLCMLYTAMGRYTDAIKEGEEAKRIWMADTTTGTGHLAINCNGLGLLYMALRDYKTAEPLLLQARRLWKDNLGTRHPYYTQATLNLATLYWNNGQTASADSLFDHAFHQQYDQLQKVFAFSAEGDKQSYLQNVTGSEDQYQSFYFDKGDPSHAIAPYSIALSKRNLILSSTNQMRAAILQSGDPALLATYNEWMDAKKQLAVEYTSEDASSERIKDLEAQANQLEKKMARASSAFRSASKKPVDWKSIQQKLKPNEAAIEFSSFNFYDGQRYTDSIYYTALLLRKDRPAPELIFLFEQKRLDSLFKTTVNRENVNAFYARGVKVTRDSSVSGSAYKLIWAPLEKKLQGIDRIYYAPSGLLHRVSFAGLPLDSLHTLCEKYQLVQMATTAGVVEQQAVTIVPGDNLELLGGIQYNGNDSAGAVASYWPSLPGTEQEVDAIARDARKHQLSISVLKGKYAKEESVKQLNGPFSPSILHIATHGYFFPAKKRDDKISDTLSGGIIFREAENPLIRSGLLFAGANDAWQHPDTATHHDDGILTAYEVSNLYLPHTKLVVLSACETALGDIEGSEGVYGLQRAFRMAGVRNLVMSLWKVPDHETAEFMHLFYDNLLKRKTIDAAFYETQKSMRKNHRDDAYKWAAWVLIK